ncbi:MAG: hypothetical protein WA790_15850 [Sulfitobacter sp.]
MTIKFCTPDKAFDAASLEMFGAFDVADKDCCRTAGRAFHRLWGVNPVVGANYTSQLGALRFLRSYGGAERCHEALAARAGLVPCDALPGVIGAVEVDFGPMPWALGLCIQTDEWAVMGMNGLHVVKSTAKSWGLPWD